MARRLFSELSPTTYQIALARRRMQRRIADGLRRSSFARQTSQESLPVKVYTHNSLIRRRLGNAQPELQEGKAVSLGLAAPHVDGILIRPERRSPSGGWWASPAPGEGSSPAW